MDETKLRSVFRDAQIVDVDFSLWDERCRFVVIALEERPQTGKRLPLYSVDFVCTERITFAFSCQAVPRGHLQWNVDEMDISTSDKALRIRLSSSPQFPVVEVHCRDVVVSPCDPADLDFLVPGWNMPGAPLARPGLEQLANAARARVRSSGN